jgi:hypothetical protein
VADSCKNRKDTSGFLTGFDIRGETELHMNTVHELSDLVTCKLNVMCCAVCSGNQMPKTAELFILQTF